MKQLFDAAFEIVKLLPPSRVETISNQIMTLSSSDDKKSILMLVNSANAKKVIGTCRPTPDIEFTSILLKV